MNKISKFGLTAAIISIAMLNIRKAQIETKEYQPYYFSLEALANGESGGGETGGNNEPCHSSVTQEVMEQDCGGIKRTIREAITFQCEGDQPGICTKGAEYYYYDCNGQMIQHLDNTYIYSCI
ncbi:hypothetical protein [uncultured Mediterranea sp.]|uniref:hypothetical protein n=1 Tax=uncultured Mediterranea sp. TaxID=1926662 RepID=UPI0027D9481C|nr:hypothetical protein [uncultured Mediterranea sp.]